MTYFSAAIANGAVHPAEVGEAFGGLVLAGFTHGGDMKADYRGEVKVILANLGQEPFAVVRGERIAQLVPSPVTRAAFTETDMLGETVRGSGGFGSTGR